MAAYLIRRLLLVIPTLWAIITINFYRASCPGGPVDQAIAAIELGHGSGFGGGGAGEGLGHARAGIAAGDGQYRGSRGLDPEVIAEITKRYGFDKPLHERYFTMLWNYMRFDFGDSLFRGASVMQLIGQSLPVSITLGLWSTLIIYLVSIPLGIRKAVHNGSAFDTWSSTLIIIGYAIPAFLFAILMIVLFAGGSYLDWFRCAAWCPATSTPLVAGEDRRLPVAHHPAGAGDGDRRLRHPDHADQELVPRRDPQAVRHHRPRQRAG